MVRGDSGGSGGKVLNSAYIFNLYLMKGFDEIERDT